MQDYSQLIQRSLLSAQTVRDLAVLRIFKTLSKLQGNRVRRRYCHLTAHIPIQRLCCGHSTVHHGLCTRLYRGSCASGVRAAAGDYSGALLNTVWARTPGTAALRRTCREHNSKENPMYHSIPMKGETGVASFADCETCL